MYRESSFQQPKTKTRSPFAFNALAILIFTEMFAVIASETWSTTHRVLRCRLPPTVTLHQQRLGIGSKLPRRWGDSVNEVPVGRKLPS